MGRIGVTEKCVIIIIIIVVVIILLLELETGLFGDVLYR
jgi:hypothetical protein